MKEREYDGHRRRKFRRLPRRRGTTCVFSQLICRTAMNECFFLIQNLMCFPKLRTLEINRRYTAYILCDHNVYVMFSNPNMGCSSLILTGKRKRVNCKFKSPFCVHHKESQLRSIDYMVLFLAYSFNTMIETKLKANF